MKPSHIFIIGTNRPATTSVFRYLQGHDEVMGSFKKELHYFTSVIYSSEFLFDQKEYETNFSEKNGLFPEASPSCFYNGKRLAEFLKGCLPRPKPILLLRNLTDRLFSFSDHHNVGLPLQRRLKTASFIRESQAGYESGELADKALNRGLREGVSTDYRTGWLEFFGKDLQVISFDRLKENHRAVINACLDFFALDPSILSLCDPKVHNETRDSHSFILHKLAMSVNSTLEYYLQKAPSVKKGIKAVYGFINEKKFKPETCPEQRQHAADFFKPHNLRLAKVLKENKLSIPEWALA